MANFGNMVENKSKEIAKNVAISSGILLALAGAAYLFGKWA